MNKIINILIIVALSITLINAQYNPISQEVFNNHLEELKEKGTLNKEITENIEKLHYSQKEQIISTIKFESKEFWNQWKNEFSIEQKRALLKEVSLEKRNEFMKKYGEHYGVNFVNLGDENILFGKENTIGNQGTYFQMDMIENYNKKNTDNKIASIEYKKNSMIFKYEKGNSLEISTEGSNGFYFNPDSNYLGKVGNDENIERSHHLTGHWNGKGNLKLSTNEKGTNINFDFNRDTKGKAQDPIDYSKFTNLKGESYSVFQDPTGKDEKGNNIYELKSGELNFDSEGKLTKISNIYKNPEINKNTKSWGGFFGKDTSVVYNEGEFESTKGSKILVDIEKGQIKAESARIEEGLAADAKNVISKLQEGIEKIREKIDDKLSKISNAHDILKKAQDKFKTADKIYNENPYSFSNDAKRLAASYELIKTQEEIRKGIAKAMDLSPDDKIVKDISTLNGLRINRNNLRYGSSFLGAAGDISTNLLGGIDSATANINNPLLKSLNPAPDSRINLQLNNPSALNLKKVEMYDGSLEIADSYGNLVPVVKRATSYGYVLPSTLNKETNYFNGINFDLYNSNYKDRQNIKIFSDSGKLNAVGIGGLKDLKTVNGKYIIDAGGGISYHYNVLGLFKGGGYEGSTERILTADYKSNAKADAFVFQTNANAEYQKLYENSQEDGWTKQEITELTQKYNNNFIEYNKILNSKDIDLSISSSKLSQILNSFSLSENSLDNSIIHQIELDTFNNDQILQKQLAERGIHLSNIKPFVDKEIVNINNFVKSNAGTNLQFVKDSSNGIYQIKTNGVVYNIDPSVGPFISSTLPVLISHGGLDSNGNFYLDTRNSRFGNAIGINVYGGHYEGVKASKWAQKNADSIRQGITNKVQEIIGQKIIDPSSR